MSKLFPPEIIENSTQQHFIDNHTKSKIIYIIVIVVILIAFSILPLIKIDITTQNRGIIRSTYENNRLQLVVSGEVKTVLINENKTVQKGDTLIKIKTDKIDEQILALKQKIQENNRFIKDLKNLNARDYKNIETANYLAEYNQYLSRIKEQETKIVQLEKEYSISKQLFEEDITPQMEYLKIKNNYEIAISQVQSLKEQYLNKWQIEQTRLKFEKLDFTNSISQLEKEKNHYFLIAPIPEQLTSSQVCKMGVLLLQGK